METMQPTLRNGRSVWDKQNMPQSEFDGRVARARAAMARDKIDALLVYGFAYNDYADPTYLSNFTIRLPNGAMMILPANSEPVIVFEGNSKNIPSLRDITWVKDLRSAGDCAVGAVECLKEKGILAAQIGFCGVTELMPAAQLQKLRDALERARVVEAGGIIRNMRMVKSGFEKEQIKRAAAMISRCLDAMAAARFPEISERKIAAWVRRDIHLQGAEDVRILLGRAKEPDWRLRPPEEGVLADGEPIVLYIGCSYERYWAERIRTFTATLTGLSQISVKPIDDVYATAIGEIKPGLLASAVAQNLTSLARQAGIITIDHYGIGTGIGLAPVEAPQISSNSRVALAEGMALTLRIAGCDAEVGTYMTGDTLILECDRTAVLV